MTYFQQPLQHPCLPCLLANHVLHKYFNIWLRFSLPSFNSPKFPQPIFLPTRKFGPTMRTPEELEEPDGRDGCPLRPPWDTLALLCRSPYLSLCWSMVRAAQVSRSLEWCTKRPPGPGPPQPQPWSLEVPGWYSHSHGTKLDAADRHSDLSSPSPLRDVRPQHLSQEGEGERPVTNNIWQYLRYYPLIKNILPWLNS